LRQVIGLEIDGELLNEFVSEAKAHIADMEAGLLRMEAGESDDDVINRIFRAAHSIKGTAGFFGLNKIVELAHAIEALFGELREHRLKANSDIIDTLLETADKLKELVHDPEGSESYDIRENLAAIKNSVILPVNDAETPQTDDRHVQEALANVQRQNQDGPVRETTMDDSIRVNVSVLNDLVNLAGELVLWRNQLLRIAQEADRQMPQLEAVAKGIDELTTNLQKNVMKTRMQPIANVFNKFPRIVRDLSRKTDKEIDLVMRGMNVELDRSLIESLVDPMTHLVRNAIDHGIERTTERQAHNKPLAGSLVLHAYQESGRVIIDICDDGAGIDPEKIKAKALQKGLAGEKEIGGMNESDILNLIMRPGFSLAEKVTDLSGRGVGMDVVKTNIEKLGGKVEVISEMGAGTTFRLILPLTLAIISALIVKANKQSFVIPQANIRELVLIQPGEPSENRIKMVNGRPVLLLRGRLLPLAKLSDLLADDRLAEPNQAVEEVACQDQTLRILVIKAGRMPYGLIVDSIYDTEELLVKPLPAALGNCGLYSGVTILGDGSIVMILDTENLRRQAGFSTVKESSDFMDVPVRKKISEELQYVLLFKCAGGEMLGMDLAMVSRVEEVELSQLQKIGSKYYYIFQGQTIRVIRPEHYLPISRNKKLPSKFYIILPKLMKHPVGIIAQEIHDAVYTTVLLDKDGVCGDGIVGSALINDSMVTFLNIHELFVKAVPEYYKRLVGANKMDGKFSFAGEKEEGRKTILLVEDTPFFLKVIQSYLESDGYQVITAENGVEAYEKLGQIRVDAVVSDIEMPLMTGIELVRAIRANEALRHLPVIALTSLTGDVNKEKGIRAGFDVYEYKLDRTRLLDSLRHILQQRA